MAENSAIEWTDHTFNPWIGCTKVSPACDHCYAETWDARGLQGKATRWGPHAARTRTSAANWHKPIIWNRKAEAEGRRYRVFCASLADVFDNHGSITSGWHGDLWHLIARTPHLDWLLLTKRPQNIPKMLPESYGAPTWGDGWPNVWLGTTVENQEEADRRIPALLSIPAKIRFLSVEPMLGPVDLTSVKPRDGYAIDALAGVLTDFGVPMDDAPGKLHWVICGGESGPGARPMHPKWARDLRDQCQRAGVPFLFKQWGEWAPLDFGGDVKAGAELNMDAGLIRASKKAAGRMLDGRTWDEVPHA